MKPIELSIEKYHQGQSLRSRFGGKCQHDLVELYDLLALNEGVPEKITWRCSRCFMIASPNAEQIDVLMKRMGYL